MISDYITPKEHTDLERGATAYINGDVKAYVTGSKDFKSGYKEAFDDSLPSGYDDLEREVEWDQHYFDEIEPAMKSQEAKQRLHASVAALVISTNAVTGLLVYLLVTGAR